MSIVSGRFAHAGFALTATAFLAQPCLAQPQVWRLTAKPLLVLGADDNPQTEFHQIKGVTRLDNGTLAVANGSTNEIRIFSSNGELLRTIGRTGSGPGEFRSINWLGRSTDTLLIADHVNARITRYLIDGTRLETIPILARDASRRFTVVGRLPNGRWLVRTSSSPTIYGRQRVLRDTAHIGLMNPDAAGHIRWLASFPGLTFFLYNPANGEHGLSVGVVPFGPTLVTTILAGRILLADTDRPIITALAEDGSTAQDFHLPLSRAPLTEGDIAPRRAAALEGARGEAMEAYFTTLYSRSILPKTKPLHGGMIATSDQQLWVLPYLIGSRTEFSYLVLSKSGQLIATVPVPSGFHLREVGSDYALGIHIDDDGVERTHLYGLVKRP